jgi:predicted metalloprotease
MVIGGGFGLVLVVAYLLLGGDPGALLNSIQEGGGPAQTESRGIDPANDPQAELKQFVSVVLADTEDVWNQQFQAIGRDYQEPTLVLFSGQTQTACGHGTAATGPFYCPGDNQVYIDLEFYRTLKERLGAPGDFAQAYVIAHEVGHHVQRLLGTTQKVDQLRGRISEEEMNALSVRVELQADYFAGVWAHYAQRMNNLDPGDIEEALNAASAIGDDTLQKQSQGYAVPDSFTHGTSEQRVRWFTKGLKSGDMRQGDTFNARDL